MTTDDDPILTPDELDALRRLPRETAPPPSLERRLLTELRREGRIGSRFGGPQTPIQRLAAGLLLFAIGIAVGLALPALQPASQAADDNRPRFLLLLYDSIGDPADEELHRRLAREYGGWASELAASGHLIGGEPLAHDGRLLAPPSEPDGTVPEQVAETPTIEAEGRLLVGYFLIRAHDYAQAESLAQQCPHLRHGGSVLVRRIR